MKYNSNAVSDESPSYFKSSFVEIKKNASHSLGKRYFPIESIKNILSPKPDYKPKVMLKTSARSDQDLDSLKLSIQPDITKGYKNTVRFQSNYYKSFFEKVQSLGFRRLSTEITNLHKMPKVLRTLKQESPSKSPPKLIKIQKNEQNEYSRRNDLSYLLELDTVKNKKNNLPKILNKNTPESEIEIFEKRLKQESFEKSKTIKDLYYTKKK
jgi:hypothetical protein